MAEVKQNRLRRRGKITLIVVLALALGVFLVRQFYSVYPLWNSTYGFQYYTPTQLPSGFKIMDKRVDIISYGGKTHGVSAELNLRTEDWVYEIMESRHTDEQTTTPLTNYDPHSIGVTCEQQTSPKGQEYRLCHWVDYGKISVFEAKFIKGNTFINTTFPTTTDKVVPVSEISNYVDSFKKSNTAGWSVLSGSV
jgi:hypothetical protein